MKKSLLLLGFILLSFISNAQIILYIQEPPSLQGSLELIWTGGWAGNLQDPSNAITGELVFVTDGTFQDSLGCGTLTNANQLKSKVGSIILDTDGTGYTSAENVSTISTQTGSGTGLTVDITANAIGSVLSLSNTFINVGSDYETEQSLPTTTNGAGLGLTVNIIAEDGEIVSIEIDEPGFGYAVGDEIFIIGGSNDAMISITSVGNGEITSVELNELGSGYILGDTLIVSGGNQNAIIFVDRIDGKIAVVYRGDCEFGLKSLNAQNAGAIGIIIINNIPGPPVGMAPGAVGANVNIPVVMITDIAGASLKNQINQGGVIAFIGNKLLVYENDLGMFKQHILRPKSASTVNMLALNDGELSFKVGATVNNYGRNDQTEIILNAIIYSDTDTVYANSSQRFDLESGTSIFVKLQDANLVNLPNGHYTMKYTVSSPVQDNFTGDNVISTPLFIDDNLFTHARVDKENNKPVRTDAYRSAFATDNFDMCMVFRDPNASRLAIKGVTFSAVTDDEHSLEGEFVRVRLIKWNDNFEDLDDTVLGFNNLSELSSTEYDYFEDLQGEFVNANFGTPVILEDNQRYLICAGTYSQYLFFGYDSRIDYTSNINDYRQPQSPIVFNNTWDALGFGSDLTPSLGIYLIDKETINVKEVASAPEIRPYPNPASQSLNIPFATEKNGMADLFVFDITGKMITSERVNITNNSIKTMETNSLNNGTYIFKVIYEDGSNTSFKVLISK
jgi:hypothetical protein